MSDTLSSRTAESESASGHPASTKLRHRPSWIAFVVLGAIVCIGMGVWQLARYQDVSGTVQNLGYTFMWPFLGGFLIYAYVKYIRLEAEEGAELAEVDGEDDDDEAGQRSDVEQPAESGSRARTRGAVATEIPADLLPTRRAPENAQAHDEGLKAYNSYLAELAREDNRQDTTAGGNHQERPAS